MRVEYGWTTGRTVTFGWQSDLTVDGLTVELDSFPRYSSAFSETAWGARYCTGL